MTSRPNRPAPLNGNNFRTEEDGVSCLSAGFARFVQDLSCRVWSADLVSRPSRIEGISPSRAAQPALDVHFQFLHLLRWHIVNDPLDFVVSGVFS
jgi:hypothetical protein